VILAIDPGTKPGACVVDSTGVVVRASHRLEDIDEWQRQLCTVGVSIEWRAQGQWPLVAAEGQWYYGPQRKAASGQERHVDVNDLLKLAFRAGWQLRSVPALRHLRIPPQVWRGASSANKLQMQKRILRDLTPAERELFRGIPEARHGDVLDAVGIGKCALKLAATTREYDYK
jgi:hypothetical protein